MIKNKDFINVIIPEDNVKFRKFIKDIDIEYVKELDKNQLQILYDRAKIAYPEGGKQISRNERNALYIIQEQLFGILDVKVKSSLENIGKTLVKKANKRKKKVNYNLPSSDAVITKMWKGERLEIKIVKDGFEYKGNRYKSLSKLAQYISGYAVSGPIFFGLRKPKLKAI